MDDAPEERTPPMTVKPVRPVAKFRQFAIEQLGDDPVMYKVADIADLASVSEDEDVARLNTQQVGDMLRSWAREHQIFQGWVCLETRNEGAGARAHSRFRIARKSEALNGAYGKPDEPPVFTGPPIAQDMPLADQNGHGRVTIKPKTGARFSGKVLDVKADGSMLVTNPDGAFSVRPVKW
jgi:hypothetical protein